MYAAYFDSADGIDLTVNQKNLEIGAIKGIEILGASSFKITNLRVYTKALGGYGPMSIAALRNSLYYYPKFTIAMLLPAVISLMLFVLLFFNIITIHPLVLLWMFVSFGGMYLVTVAASKELKNENHKSI